MVDWKGKKKTHNFILQLSKNFGQSYALSLEVQNSFTLHSLNCKLHRPEYLHKYIFNTEECPKKKRLNLQTLINVTFTFKDIKCKGLMPVSEVSRKVCLSNSHRLYHQRQHIDWKMQIIVPVFSISKSVTNIYTKLVTSRDARMVKMVGFLIPDNPASSMCRIGSGYILNLTVFRNRGSSLVPWLTYVQTWIAIVINTTKRLN